MMEHVRDHGGMQSSRAFGLNSIYFRWCTTPVYTLTAKGQLQMREPSWVVPGAAESEYTLHRVYLVAYSEDVVDEVMQRVNR